jgi:HPt (histidine-containing phosphotransfer) domain-containing protein
VDYDDAMVRFRQKEALYFKYLFRLPADKLLEQSIAAFEAENYEAAREAAHSLKGLAANLSAVKLNESCKKFVEAIRSSDYPSADCALREMKKAFQNSKEAIEKIMTEYSE